MRRLRVFAALVLIFVITTLFYTASLRQQRAHDLDTHAAGGNDFYGKTRDALNRVHAQEVVGSGSGGRDDDDEEVARAMKQRLDEAAQLAKDKANVKAPKPDNPSKLVGVGNAADAAWESEKSVAGRKKFPIPDSDSDVQKPVHEETEEEHMVEVELNSILKKSPSKYRKSSMHIPFLLGERLGLGLLTIEFPSSNHLLQILLPALEACKAYPSGQIRH